MSYWGLHDPNSDPGLGTTGQFSVVVKSFGAPVVSVVNEHQNVRNQQRQEALSYQGLSEGSTKTYAPYFAYNVNGWLTTLVVQNLGTLATTVSLQFASFDGTQKPLLTRDLQPGRAQFVDPARSPVAVQILALGLIFNTSGTIVNVGVAWLAGSLRVRIESGAGRTWFQRASGAVLIGLGVRLALARSS